MMGTTGTAAAGVEKESTAPESLFSGSSRLCPTLQHVLSDQEALPHLIDFMEDRKILHFLRFWLDCEQFYRVCTTEQEATGDSPQQPSVDAVVRHDFCQLSTTSLEKGSQQELFKPANSRDNSVKIGFLPTNCSSTASKDSEISPLRPNGFLGLAMKRSPSSRRFNKDIQDNAVRIYSQYVSLEAPDSVGIDPEMRRQILDNMCQEDEQVGIDCFRAAQDKIFEILNDKIFLDFLSSFHFLRYKSSLILSDRVSLADILNCNRTLEQFLIYVEEAGGIEFLRFVLSSIQYEAQWNSAVRFGDYNAEWAQKDAMVIYDRYISMQAECAVDLPDGLRISVEERICSERGAPADCFRVAVNAVYCHLTQIFFPGFFKSQSFMSYLVELDAELKKAMLVTGVMSSVVRKRNAPKSLQKYQRSNSAAANHKENQDAFPFPSSVSVPSSESGLYRPESECDSRSWNSLEFSGITSKLKKMAIGEVDALGRFVSYGETEPVEGPKTGIFNRTIRKLNRSDENRRKKEQASLDAQRIIEDTLSQAMSSIPPFSG